jgi:hypothetical protein
VEANTSLVSTAAYVARIGATNSWVTWSSSLLVEQASTFTVYSLVLTGGATPRGPGSNQRSLATLRSGVG